MSLASRSHVERREALSPMGTCLFGLLTVCLTLFACGPDYPKCDDDEDCHKGEFCINNLCQQCRNNADCAPANAGIRGHDCFAVIGFIFVD